MVIVRRHNSSSCLLLSLVWATWWHSLTNVKNTWKDVILTKSGRRILQCVRCMRYRWRKFRMPKVSFQFQVFLYREMVDAHFCGVHTKRNFLFLWRFLIHFPAQHFFSSIPISTSSGDPLVSVTDPRCHMYIAGLPVTPQAWLRVGYGFCTRPQRSLTWLRLTLILPNEVNDAFWTYSCLSYCEICILLYYRNSRCTLCTVLLGSFVLTDCRFRKLDHILSPRWRSTCGPTGPKARERPKHQE